MYTLIRKMLMVVILTSLLLSFTAHAEGMRMKIDKTPEKNPHQRSYNHHHKHHNRYDSRYYPVYSPDLVKKTKNYHRKKYHSYLPLNPDIIYVLPKGSRVVVINGHKYHRWQDRYYQRGLYNGSKAYISVNLSF
ncbi:MAG: hypothetical protein ACRBB6_02190 [Neptuniibacter sp.]